MIFKIVFKFAAFINQINTANVFEENKKVYFNCISYVELLVIIPLGYS